MNSEYITVSIVVLISSPFHLKIKELGHGPVIQVKLHILQKGTTIGSKHRLKLLTRFGAQTGNSNLFLTTIKMSFCKEPRHLLAFKIVN